MGKSPSDGCHIRSFFRNPVIEIVLPFKWVCTFFSVCFFSDGWFVVNHLIQIGHSLEVGSYKLQSGSLPLEMQLKGLDFPYQLVQDWFHQQV